MKVVINLMLIVGILSSCSKFRYRKRGSRGYRTNDPKAAMAPSIRKKVALLDFFNDAPVGGNDLAITATEEIRRELAKTKSYVLDPLSNRIFGSSREVFAGGGVKLVQLAKKAKLAGVNLVIYGRVTQARIRQRTDEIGLVRKTKSLGQVEIELHVFDINASKEILISKKVAHVDDNTFRFYMKNSEDNLLYRRKLLRYSAKVAVRKFVPILDRLGKKLDWVGRVARIIGTKVYVNAGRKSGVHVGDIMKVMTSGEEIFDPETGALLGVSKGEVKGTIEIIDYFGVDGAIAVLHSGGSVTEGDFLQLY